MSVAETRSAASAAIPSADDLIARARALAPKLRERASLRPLQESKLSRYADRA